MKEPQAADTAENSPSPGQDSSGKGSPVQDKKGNGKHGLLKSSGIVSVMTLLSRILGLVRDMVVANYFGASAGADSFFLAFRIPNFFRRLFGEGAFSQAFIPVLSEYQKHRSPDEVRELVRRIGGSLGLILFVLALLGVLFADWFIRLFAMGFVYTGAKEKLALASDMLVLTFPYVFLICMTAFAGSVLNSYGRFGPPAFTPVLLNVCLIGAAIFLQPYMAEPVMALAWGVLMAGVVQLLFQMPYLAREKMLVWPRPDYGHEGVKRVMTLMVPAMFGVSVGQINLLLDTVLASFLETGSLSWLYYSDRLLELPLALFGITIATVILPNLSRQHHEADGSETFNETLDWAVRMVCLIGVPASLALVILAEPLLTTLFFRGEMTERDITMASLSLMAYGVGLLGHMLVKVLAPGFYARQDTETPVRYGIIALTSNMVLNLLLIWQFKHAGLALATSLSAFINAGLLFWGLRKVGHYKLLEGWGKLVWQMLIANTAMVAFLLLIMPERGDWLALSFVPRLMYMLGICLAGGVIYAAGLWLTGLRFRSMVR